MTRLFQTVLPFLVIGVLLSLLIRANPVQAQPSSVPIQQEERSNNFYPNLKPNLNVPIITSKITIDGDLGERAWQEAAVATNFSENYPREKRRPPIGIKAYMAYDAENVYVAYVIEDDPARIRAHMNDRDNIWQDDYAGMLLDTQGDGQVTYFIAANPLGIQGDTRSGNGEEDMSFDLIYDSAGKITETGYQVEMAIPFRSLRFPNTDVQEWRATFWITRPREDRSQYT